MAAGQDKPPDDASTAQETIFYAFSRPDSWIDPEYRLREIWKTETFGPNAPGIIVEPYEMPDVHPNWSRYDLTVPESAFSRYFSDIVIEAGLLRLTPDVFRLGNHLYVSERARTVLSDCGEGHHNFIPARIYEADANRNVRSDLYILIPKTVFYCDIDDDQGVPRIDFHPAASGAIIRSIQDSARLASYLGGLGLWCTISRYGKPFFNPSTFTEMLRSGISGLVEKKSSLRLVYNDDETIGHVFR